MTPIIENWKRLTPFEKIGAIATVVGLVAAVYGGYAFFVKKTKDTEIRIVVFDKKTHLGDNDQATYGGTSLPYFESPGAETGAHLLVFDKKDNRFISTGFPTEVMGILNYYGGRYQESNLSAYQHVVGIEPSEPEKDQYPGSSVQIDLYTKLVWVENGGSFYHEKAAVGITSTINLFQHLKENGFYPEETKIKKAKFWYHGLHSGKRQSQPDNVELVVNSKVHQIKFKSNKVREEELVAVTIDPEIINLSPTSTNRFTLVVLPYQEKFPIPPPSLKGYKQVGPGHFRDIELWKGTLELVID